MSTLIPSEITEEGLDLEDNDHGFAEEIGILRNQGMDSPEGGIRSSRVRVEDIKGPEQCKCTHLALLIFGQIGTYTNVFNPITICTFLFALLSRSPSLVSLLKSHMVVYKGACFLVEDVRKFKDAVNGSFMKGGEKGLKTQTSNKTRLTLQCPEPNCEFIIALGKQTADSTWKVTKANKTHNCQNDVQLEGRQRAHPFRVISAVHKEVAAWTSTAGSTRATQSLLNTAKTAGADLTKDQAKKHSRQNQPDISVQAWIEQLAQLPSYVRHLQEQDPLGLYVLELSDVSSASYPLLPAEALACATMVRRYVFFPSQCKIELNVSNKQIVCVDGAHCSSAFGGTLFSFVGTDCFDHLILLGWGWSPGHENSDDIEFYFAHFRQEYPELQIVISDEGTAFKHLRAKMNLNALGKKKKQPVWMGCAVHVAAAAHIPRALSYLVKDIAMSTDQEQLDEAMRCLRNEATAYSYNYVESKLNLFSFLYANQNLGLQQQLGMTSSNPVEVFNNMARDNVRVQPVITGIVSVFSAIGKLHDLRLKSAREQAGEGLVVNARVLRETSARGRDILNTFAIERTQVMATNAGPSVIFTCAHKTSVAFRFTVSLCIYVEFPDNIRCSACTNTAAHGMPCRHAAAILVQGQAVEKMMFSINAKKWFSSVFHAVSAAELPLCASAPNCSPLSLQMYRVLGPRLGPKSHFRRQTRRIKSRSQTVGTSVPREILERDASQTKQDAIVSSQRVAPSAQQPCEHICVQCSTCLKWRFVDIAPATEDTWVCTDSKDRAHNDCEAPEDEQIATLEFEEESEEEELNVPASKKIANGSSDSGEASTYAAGGARKPVTYSTRIRAGDSTSTYSDSTTSHGSSSSSASTSSTNASWSKTSSSAGRSSTSASDSRSSAAMSALPEWMLAPYEHVNAAYAKTVQAEMDAPPQEEAPGAKRIRGQQKCIKCGYPHAEGVLHVWCDHSFLYSQEKHEALVSSVLAAPAVPPSERDHLFKGRRSSHVDN